jgi:hypothetical protein
VRDEAQDADMVSGMLTAIRDFVQDAFRNNNNAESLDALRVGELEVFVEQGPLAVLAGVIRGAAPKELHTLFQETLERIHGRYGRALENFEGDTEPFTHLQPDLEQCLKSGYRREQHRKISPALAVVLLAVSVFGVWFAVSSFLEGRRWSAYVRTLRDEPGLLVVAERTGWWTHSVAGLRDPLARDPFTLMTEAGLNPARVDARWEAFQAAEPTFVLQRARDILTPPAGVELSFANGVLLARGTVDAVWVNQARMVSKLIPGVAGFAYETPFDAIVARLRPAIEGCRLYFSVEAVTPQPEQRCGWDNLIGHVRELAATAAAAARHVQVSVIGYADMSGSSEPNMLLSQARAESVRAALVAAVPGLDVVAIGRGGRRSGAAQSMSEDRIVTFRVSVDEAPAPAQASERR